MSPCHCEFYAPCTDVIRHWGHLGHLRFAAMGSFFLCCRPPLQSLSSCSWRVSANSAAQQASKSNASKFPREESVSLRKSKTKPPRLLRTWKEGRRVLSKPKPLTDKIIHGATAEKPIQNDELDQQGEPLVLDSFYLHLEDSENEEGSDNLVHNDAGDEDDAVVDSDIDEDLTYSSDDANDTADVAFMEEGHESNNDTLQTTNLNCEHFSRCSGCVLDTALDQPPMFKDARCFFSDHAVHDLKLTTGSVWEWRCKAKLAVRGTSDAPLIGLYADGTHEIVDIPKCRTHHPRINAVVDILKEGIRMLGVKPYDEDSGTGELRYVQMSVTTYNTSISTKDRYLHGTVQVALVWNARSEQSSSGTLLTSLAQFLWQKAGVQTKNPLIHSIWANFQTSRTNIIFGGRWRHLLGQQQCWERIGGVDISLTPATFSQTNLQVFESLLRKLQKFVKPGKRVVELYAGSGIIGLSLAANCNCRAVRCVEVNKEAAAPFEAALSRLPGAVKSRVSWHGADVSVSPIIWLQGFDVVLVDPPRKGLDSSVVEALRTASFRGQGRSKPPSEERLEKIKKRPWIVHAKQSSIKIGDTDSNEGSTWPEMLIYISCDWDSFKSDCASLVEGGAWHLFAGHAFNFFPGTDSIEVLAVFKHGKRVKSKKKGSKKKKVRGCKAE